jgi:hypothetical protein
MKNALLIFGFILIMAQCKGQETNDLGGLSVKKLSDEELMTLVQRQTFQYFWEGAVKQFPLPLMNLTFAFIISIWNMCLNPVISRFTSVQIPGILWKLSFH